MRSHIKSRDLFFDADEPLKSSINVKRYSDVRPYEDRRYWYFTTHGIGPGTIPKDLNVLEVQEGQNDKGTWGTFVCLDGVLNTSELSYYDMREMSPSNVNSSVCASEEVYDEDDEWSPYHGGTYRIDGKAGDVSFSNDPKDAIRIWFMKQKTAPMDVAISCKTRQQAVDLCRAATSKLLSDLYSRYSKCPYKLDYLIDESRKQVEKGCKYFYENEYGYGDSVHPFGVG